ncbi:hypothetical protein H6775_02400 [Candidatus Nomurabacteria bacterium]|nr:hypothetical protein [Candidatus Nomurabacteria bacterium]
MNGSGLFNQDTLEAIFFEAERLLGKSYGQNTFNCVHFVITVFDKVGIPVPMMDENIQLPVTHNNLGGVILLDIRTKKPGDQRNFTHCGIVHTNGLIHCSRQFGRCVSITPWDKVWQKYELAEL